MKVVFCVLLYLPFLELKKLKEGKELTLHLYCNGQLNAFYLKREENSQTVRIRFLVDGETFELYAV